MAYFLQNSCLTNLQDYASHLRKEKMYFTIAQFS